MQRPASRLIEAVIPIANSMLATSFDKKETREAGSKEAKLPAPASSWLQNVDDLAVLPLKYREQDAVDHGFTQVNHDSSFHGVLCTKSYQLPRFKARKE